MKFETNKEKGRAGISLAIAYFGTNGYTVSVPLDDTQEYDLVVEKEGVFYSVQCKATGHKTYENTYSLSLRNMGGTKGTQYGNVIESGVDLLFAITEDKTMYLIPIKDIPELSFLSLRKEKSKFAKKDVFDTSRYIVTI